MENYEKIIQRFKELEQYRDMDLHDSGCLADIRGINEELQKEGWLGNFQDLVNFLSDDFLEEEGVDGLLAFMFRFKKQKKVIK